MYRKYRSEEEWNIVEGYLNGIFSLEEKRRELGYKTALGLELGTTISGERSSVIFFILPKKASFSLFILLS